MKRYDGAMPSGTTLVSEQEYLSTNYKPACDYIDGVLRQKPMGTRKHGKVQIRLGHLFAAFPDFEASSELTVKLRTGKYFVPDVAVQRCDRIQDPYPEEPVHLCIEIMSPSDRFSDVVAKCAEYHDWGVETTWIIDPDSQEAWEYHRGQPPVEVSPSGSLTAEGISIPVADIFAGL